MLASTGGKGVVTIKGHSLPVSTCCTHAVLLAALQRRFPSLCHPIGLYTVCLAVFCERCAAYSLGASMVLLLCARYGCASGDALRLAALVNAVNYLGTLPGGLAVDRVIDARRALEAGMALLDFGYAALTLSAPWALWLALLLLALGHARFKPST